VTSSKATVVALTRRIASNRALQYTALNQCVRLLLGPAVLIALPIFLTAEELGFWYAMTGVAAILAFADMGLSTAVLQFSAHEHASSRMPDTSPNARAIRQDALLVFALRRIGRICLVGVPVVFLIGAWSMGRSHGEAIPSWLLPWASFCIASALALMVSVMLAFREGRDGVWIVQRLRAGMSFVTLAMTIAGAALGLGIWTLALASLATSLLGFGALANGNSLGILRLRTVPAEAVRAWSKEMSTILTRFSLSWVGGYIMFQMFAPIAIYFQGPVLAGRVGLTVSIFTAISSLANVWLLFRLPLISKAIALKNAPLLRRVFLSGLAAATASYILLATAILTAYFLFRGVWAVDHKLLDPVSISLLAVGWGCQVVVNNTSLFLRAFKVEQLVLVTWVSALYTAGGAGIYLHLDRPDLMFVPFVSSYVLWLPTIYFFCRQRLRQIAAWPAPH
jgi:hypothetical protein